MPLQDDTFADDLGALRGRIDRRLAHLLSTSADESDLIGTAMKAALLSPGKRVRPLIVVLAGSQLGAREAPLLDLGCALEMVHAASWCSTTCRAWTMRVCAGACRPCMYASARISPC
ncbi:hypothetical protein ACFSHR_06545 [Azotobacter chroococcum]